jgi:U3 small nucleolar RNA-associated protein 4
LNSQLSEINVALQGRYIPALGASFEPLSSSHSSNGNGVINKLVIWGNEFLLTARIDISDLNSRILSNKPFNPNHQNMRRKRAREARDALERSTTGSSERSTPLPLQNGGEEGGMVKVHGGEVFRSIIGAAWLGVGEMVVVERPFADFVGELPPAFVSASYGRS